MISIYIKRHNKTGLLYLGKTNKKDPHKYKGSGKRWVAELKKHGCDYSTTIIEQVMPEILSERGRYWSNYYHVTTAMDDFGYPIWANIIPETGGGPGHKHSKETYARIAANKKGKKLLNHSEAVKKSWDDPERKLKQTNATSGTNHYSKTPGYVNPRIGRKIPGGNPKIAGDNNPAKKSEVREKMRKPHGPNLLISGENHYSAAPGYISKNSGSNHYTKRPDFVISSNNKNYDHTLYKWKHLQTNETIVMNRRDFINFTNANPGVVSDIINNRRNRVATKKWLFIGPV
jgi:hypothetical protein